MASRTRTEAELLEELAEELRRGRIVEARLHDADYHLDGLCDHDRQVIVVDPIPATVSTLLHELIHRRFPSWSERRVQREERRLIAYMDRAELAMWWRRYSRAKRVRRRPVVAALEG